MGWESDTKLPSSITNPKLRAIYTAAMKELDRINLVPALIYAVSDTLHLPIPDVLPLLASDLDVNGLEYLEATRQDNLDGPDKYTHRRAVIADSFDLHKRKGTAGIMDEVAAKTGRDAINLIEWFEFNEHLDDGDLPMPPYTYRVNVQLPISKYENSVIFGLIRDYKRFVLRQFSMYILQKYDWTPANGLTVGRYVDYAVQEIQWPDAIDVPLEFQHATVEVEILDGQKGALQFSRATCVVTITISDS